MDSKKIVEDIFRKNNIKWEVKDFGTYIDPKCKTANSIYDKLFRLYNNKSSRVFFSIAESKIDDLMRMTIIVDYDKVVATIKKLKKRFKDLTGYLQIEEAGYRGVHLNLKIDGLPCEIQLAPKVVVMTVDYLHSLYEKWRSFDYCKEITYLKEKENVVLNGNLSKPEKAIELASLAKEKHIVELRRQEEANDFKLRKKTYGEIFEVSGFESNKNEIKNELDKINLEEGCSSPLTNKKILSILNENLLINGELDKNKVKEVSGLLSQNIAPYQEKFIKNVKECLNL